MSTFKKFQFELMAQWRKIFHKFLIVANVAENR